MSESPKTRNTNPLSQDGCYLAAKGYRAVLTEWMTRKVPLNSIGDVEILVDKLTARFLFNPESSIEVAERLLELNPQMYSARKALVLAKFHGAYQEATNVPGDRRWDELDTAMTKFREMSLASAERQEELGQLEILVALKRYGDCSETRNQIAAYRTANPKTGWGPYFTAWAESKSGNRQLAMDSLNEAIQMDPPNPVFKQTLLVLWKMGPGQKMDAAFGAALPADFDADLR